MNEEIHYEFPLNIELFYTNGKLLNEEIIVVRMANGKKDITYISEDFLAFAAKFSGGFQTNKLIIRSLNKII